MPFSSEKGKNPFLQLNSSPRRDDSRREQVHKRDFLKLREKEKIQQTRMFSGFLMAEGEGFEPSDPYGFT
jgi:hypothetical protein